MSRLPNASKHTKWLLLLVAILTTTPAFAHKVQIAKDIGGTIHIEPNDTPQAGSSALTWIALTRKGGQVIPLQQCNCKLAVYSEPRAPGSSPLLQPSLKAVSTEGYKGIPGADIVFPKPGAYQLELKGTPKAGASFKPFVLNFKVTVASGTR